MSNREVRNPEALSNIFFQTSRTLKGFEVMEEAIGSRLGTEILQGNAYSRAAGHGQNPHAGLLPANRLP